MYQQEITTVHRTLIVIAVDQSQSMCEMMLTHDGKMKTKAENVANVVSRILSELLARARREDEVRNYYDLAVLGYSGRGVRRLIDPVREFIAVSDLPLYAPKQVVESFAAELPDGGTKIRERRTELWIEPHAEGDTPMYEALSEVDALVCKWCSRSANAASFPPIVFNITDGEATDADCAELKFIAGRIRSRGTTDGNTLLMNIHITADASARSLVFPTRGETDPDNRYASLLADCSSDMPAPFDEAVRRHRPTAGEPPYVAMGYNTSMLELLTMLDIGSRSVTDML